MKEVNHHLSSHPRKISKIFAIKLDEDLMNMKMYGNADDVKRAEREMEMSTDLLAVSGIEEPKIFKIKTIMILKFYLALCTLMNVITSFAVDGRLRAFYLIKSLFTTFGFYTLTINQRQCKSKLNLIFTGLFGASVLMESVPCIAGILVLFSTDVCSVLAGISSGKDLIENEKFLRFCRGNIEGVRIIGTGVISCEVMLDAFVFFQMVRYQKYIKTVEQERSNLNYYTGKERIALP